MEVMSIYPNRDFKREIERRAKKDGRSVSNYILSMLTKCMRYKK